MLTDILAWITNLGLLFLISSVILWGFYYRRIPRAIQLLGYYLASNLLIQVVAGYLWEKSLNNLPLLHLNTLLEFIFFSLFFREVYIDMRFFKKYFNIILEGMTLFLVYNAIFWEPLSDLNSNASSLTHGFLIGYVILYFFDAFGRVDFSKKEEQAISFICFAVLLCYAGSLFIFMFSQFITKESLEGYRLFWIVNGCLTSIFQMIVLIAISKIIFQRNK
ncbi:MAG: hypothetical protein R3D00_00065 [Bacteroidia bacterium]